MVLNNIQLEWYGAKTYRHFFKLNKYKLIKFESPDFIIWQAHNSSQGKIGLEFAKPSTTTQNIRNNITNKYFSKGMSLKEIKSLLNKDEQKFKNYGEIDEVEGIKYISSLKGLVNTSNYHDLICKAIKSKTSKLNGNYTLFQKNVLFLCPVTSFLTNQDDFIVIKDCADSLIDEHIRCFDEIIIDTIQSLIVYEKMDGKYRNRQIFIDENISEIIQKSCLLRGRGSK